MNRFEVIGIANQVYGSDTKWNGIQLQRLMRLAELYRAAEREECAEILEQNAMACENPISRSLLQSNAVAIRARGEKTEDA